MGLGKIIVLDLLSPVLPRIPEWVFAAMEDYQTTLSDAQKIRQGRRCLAQWVNRESLAQMAEDPVVTGSFCPVESAQLEGMLFEGEEGSCNLSLLLNKAQRFRGHLRTARTRSVREFESLNGGTLSFKGMQTYPVQAFWELQLPRNPLRPVVSRVGIGEEFGFGFEWTHTIWDSEEGYHGGMVEVQPPLLPEPTIRLRRPAAQKDQTRRVGTKADQERVQREEQKKREERNRGTDARGA